MILLVVAALAAAGGAARLDRTYLPPTSAAGSGGAPGLLQAPLRTPLRVADPSAGLLQQPFLTSEANPSFRVPSGGYENDHQGVVVDAAAAGPRAVARPSGLGGPRTEYGSPDSKVGEAAFRGTQYPAGPQPPRHGSPSRLQYASPGPANEPDLSAFHRPSGSSKPQIQIVRDPVANTIKYQNDIGIDKFEYAFETENGIKMDGAGESADGLRVQGGYSYTGDDGRLYSVRYTADEAGYRAAGAHLPTPPPAPAEILHALRQNAREEADGRGDDGSYDAQKYNTDDDYTKSDANGKYNEKQSNTFGERSKSASTSGAIVNQNIKDNAQSSNNGRFSSFDSSKDGSTLPSKTSTFGSLAFDNKAHKENYFLQNGQSPNSNQFNNNRFGSKFQYLPPVQSGLILNAYQGSEFSMDGRGSDFNVASQQKLQVPGLVEKPTTSFTGQNHYGAAISEQVSSNDKLSVPNQGTSIFGISNNPLSPDQISNNKQYQKISESTNSPNRGISYQSGSSSLNSFQSPLDFNGKTQTSLGGSSPSLISTSTPYFDVKPSKDYTSNVPVSGSDSDLSQNIPDGDGKISEQAILSTKEPQFTSTSPFENQGSSTLLNANNPQQSSLTSFPTSTSIVDHSPMSSLSLQPNTQAGLDETSLSNFGPTNAQPAHGVSFPFSVPSHGESNKFNGQTQGSDDSYFYNKPLKPFDTPSDRPYTASQSPFFTNKPQDLSVSTQQQSQPEFSKYPQASTLDLIKPTITTSYEHGNIENIYPTNGITQASISAFPSIVPTSSSVSFTTPTLSTFPQVGSTIATSAAQFISTNLGDQKYNTASQPQFGQQPLENKPQNNGAQSQVQKYNGEVYEYNKPAVELFASPQKQSIQTGKSNNTPQIGQHIPNSQKINSLQINQQSMPSQVVTQTSSKSEYNTSPSQFDTKQGSSFDQPTTPSRSNEQAGLPFGQKSTPPRFDLQTSKTVRPQLTPSRFGVQTTSLFGQQTTPTTFSGIQTSSSVGPQTSQGFDTQGTTLFGHKTTSSSFGVQTSPSFGHQTTPPRFGAHTNLAFGQQTTKAPFDVQSNALLGQQNTPTRVGSPTGSQFGTQTGPLVSDLQSGSLFEQKISPAQFGVPPRPTQGYQTTVSRFDGQTGTLVKQPEQQSSSPVSQNNYFANTNQINNAQDLNRKPESFYPKPLTSPQSTSISPQQSQSGGQPDRQDFTGQQLNYVTPDGQKAKAAERTEFALKPINSQVPQTVQKFGNNQLPSQTSGVSEIPGGFDSQNQNAQNKIPQTFTQENLPNLKPFGSRPQSFQSACCSQGPTGKSNIGSQKQPKPSNIGKGEQFGGPREPPRFDATGYHY